MIVSRLPWLRAVAGRYKIGQNHVVFFVIIVAVNLCAYKYFTIFNRNSRAEFLYFFKASNVVPPVSSLDIHLEDDLFGHTGDVVSSDGKRILHDSQLHNTSQFTSVGVGGGITSKGVTVTDASKLSAIFPFFNTFLPSFCDTCSVGYAYHFYLAYDRTDTFFSSEKSRANFKSAFDSIIAERCPRNITTAIHLVQCGHAESGKPTWAQNDAMREAYLDNVDYHYRVNDDTRFSTKGWMEEFVKTLSNYNPKNVGVVGPKHSGGNEFILTYDFVHRTHVDVFGFYYPRLFTDWWGDDWITGVYQPGRSTKLQHILLAHTLQLGQRYQVDFSVGNKYQAQVQIDKQTLARYVNTPKKFPTSSDQVISMSLFGRDPRYTWGAIRNAQTLQLFYPGWKLRIYIADPLRTHGSHPEWTVPTRILRTLKRLGAEFARVKSDVYGVIAPTQWRYLVIDDVSVKYFLIRDADSRFSDREVSAVNAWVNSNNSRESSAALHCIRDHPKHANTALVDGLWGGATASLRTRLKTTVLNLLVEFLTSGGKTENFLSAALWPVLKNDAFCHDSVACDRWKNSRGFPRGSSGTEYVGQEFDEHQVISSNDGHQLTKMNSSRCNDMNVHY